MSAVLDIVAARLRREQIYEDGRQRGWLEARRYYLLHREGHERNWADFCEGAVVGGAIAALAVLVVHRL